MHTHIANPLSKLALHPAWSLGIVDNRAYVLRQSDGERVAALTAPEAVALGLMNAQRSSGDIREVMQSIAPNDGTHAFDQVLNRLAPLLSERTVEQQSHQIELTSLAGVRPPNPSLGLRSLPGPKVLHWWVTSVCPKRCVYCFADPVLGGRADDASLTLNSLERIFSESAELGTKQLLVAGGEPLLRKDLPQALAYAISNGIEPGITTKHPINDALAAALAEAGLKHICLSVDSADATVNKFLIGVQNHASKISQSAVHLKQHGIAFSFECVITAFNLLALEGVVSMAHKLGASKVLAVPFEAVRRPIGQQKNQEMAVPNDHDLDRQIETIRRSYPDIEIEKFTQLADRADDSANCDIGITKLLFDSHGRVHRCYKLISDESLTGADLNLVSVARAWHDPAFRNIISPPRSRYAGSACGSCNGFSSCHSDGRCIYQSLVDNNTYYAKDRQCGH